IADLRDAAGFFSCSLFPDSSVCGAYDKPLRRPCRPVLDRTPNNTYSKKGEERNCCSFTVETENCSEHAAACGSDVVCLALISLGIQTCSDVDLTTWMTQDCRPSAVKTSPEPFGWYLKPVSMDEWRLLSDSSIAIDPSLATYDVIHVSRDIATNHDKTRDWCLHACQEAESCAAVSLRQVESATRCVLYPDTTTSTGPTLSLTDVFVSSERLPSVTSVSIPGHGILQGIAMETSLGSDRRTVVQFLGVPYARPPIGSLRFEAAQPADWSGTWDATKPRSSCVQPGDVESAASSEDCLYLNIFTPRGRVPVLVFFFNPSANQNPGLMDGSALAAVGNIIVVTANYRTAAVGFLSTGATGLRGNYGLSDQEAVLRWVHAHISLVGGDNTRVTVGAERGGADITSLHLLSSSPPLFQRMMLMGGSVFSPALVQTPSTSRRQAIDLATELGCPTSEDDKMASCLRAVPMQQLNTAQTKLLAVRGPFQSWSPVRQSVSQPASFHRVDLLLGTSEHDGLISRARRIKDFEVLQGRADRKTAFYEALSRSLGGASGNPLLKEAATWFYSLDHSPSAAGYNLFSRALNNATRDLFIICPTLQMASHWAKSNANVFLFHQPDTSAHSRTDVSVPLDVQFVFGAPHHPVSSQRFSSSDRRLSLAMMSYTSSFIRTGSDSKPGSSSALGGFHTPVLSSEAPPTYLELSPALRHQEGLSQNACSFWRQLGTRLTSSTGERVLLDQNMSAFRYPV
uniref:Carboxylesterase type B domain-containing protein n=1 Tax=Acanthochromis polyacanthus TaxID=80966 RepID=A0A3Q1H051_9TELE